MTALRIVQPETLPFEDVVYIRHGNMEPTIGRGSAVFLAPPGYTGEGVYSMAGLCGRGHSAADLRRVEAFNGSVRVTMDNFDDEPWVFSAEQLRLRPPRRVAGVVVPLTGEFADFLALRFGRRA